jgi:hypothetical protein
MKGRRAFVAVFCDNGTAIFVAHSIAMSSLACSGSTLQAFFLSVQGSKDSPDTVAPPTEMMQQDKVPGHLAKDGQGSG